MKKVLAVICFVAPSLLMGQSAFKKYLNDKLEQVKDKELAVYYMEIEPGHDQLYEATVFFNEGAIKLKGQYSDSDATIEHGYFEYFFRNGSMESAGTYNSGKKTGLWKRWDEDGESLSNRYYPQPKIKKNPVQAAHYAGGETQMQADLQKAIDALRKEMKINGHGQVQLALSIDETGAVTELQVFQSTNTELNVLAIRAALRLEQWKPSIHNGEAVSSLFILPIVL